MNTTNSKNWIRVFRLPFHLALILPFLFGAELAAWDGHAVSLPVAALATFALFLMTAACFISNDYFDYPADVINSIHNRFTGGSRVLPEGGLERKNLRAVIWAFIFIAGFIGAVLQFHFKTGDLTILLGAVGMLAAYGYTAKPIQFAYRGFGEILIGPTVGSLTVLSGYYIQTHELSWLPIIVSLPYVVACSLLLWTNEFPDYEPDKKSQKRNLVVRLGRERAARLHAPLIALMWLCFIPIFYIKNDWSVALVALPAAISGLNLAAMYKGKWMDKNEMEKICARAIIYTISIPVVLAVIFLV